MADAVKSAISCVIHIDGSSIGGQRDVQLQVDGSPIDVTNKSDSQWKTYLGGRSSWSMSGNNFVMLDSTDGTVEANFLAMWTAVTTAASVTAKFVLPTGSGNTFLSGTAYVTSLGLDGPDNEGFGGSWSLQGTGALALTDAT